MEITKLIWMEWNIEKIAAHGIAVREVQSLVDRNEWVSQVVWAHPDQVRIIGPNWAGRWLTVVLAPTLHPTEWRPVTGWEAIDDELAYYEDNR